MCLPKGPSLLFFRLDQYQPVRLKEKENTLCNKYSDTYHISMDCLGVGYGHKILRYALIQHLRKVHTKLTIDKVFLCTHSLR